MSYAHEDRALAERLAKCLEQDGLIVWWDGFLHFGDNISTRIDEKLSRASAVIVLWSRAASTSRWVQAESARAFELARLIPVRLDASDIPVPMSDLRTGDLIGWDGSRSDSRYAALVSALRTGRVRSPARPATRFGFTPRTLRRAVIGLSVVPALVLVSGWALEEENPLRGQIAVQFLQENEDRRVGLDHGFRGGDSIRFEFVTDRDAWITLLHAPPRGDLTDLLYRRIRIPAGTPRLVPQPPARLVLDGEVGVETFVARFETASSLGGLLRGLHFVPYARRAGPYTSFSADPSDTPDASTFRFELSHGESPSSSP